jgi:hypothetical protein
MKALAERLRLRRAKDSASPWSEELRKSFITAMFNPKSGGG